MGQDRDQFLLFFRRVFSIDWKWCPILIIQDTCLYLPFPEPSTKVKNVVFRIPRLSKNIRFLKSVRVGFRSRCLVLWVVLYNVLFIFRVSSLYWCMQMLLLCPGFSLSLFLIGVYRVWAYHLWIKAHFLSALIPFGLAL